MFKITKVYEGSNNLEVEDTEDGMIEVNLKWDGCINLWYGYNGVKPSKATPEERQNNVDYIHICDIDEFIEQLQEIKRIGQKHFNNEYW